MTKIFIVGAVGSEKTYFSKQLGQTLNIPYYELDKIVYDGNIKRSKNLILADFNKTILNNNWIIESVYRSFINNSFDKADYIIILDVPIITRILRIIKRWFKNIFNIEKASYKQNLKTLFDHLKWSIKAEKDKNKYTNLLKPYNKKIIILKNTNKKTLNNLKLMFFHIHNI